MRSLERDTLEFESNERILLEQLRQMRLTTGELRTTLRESIAESERVAAENAAAVAKLEKEVATLKTKLAAAEQRAAAAEAAPRQSRRPTPSRRWRQRRAEAYGRYDLRRSWPRRGPSSRRPGRRRGRAARASPHATKAASVAVAARRPRRIGIHLRRRDDARRNVA